MRRSALVLVAAGFLGCHGAQSPAGAHTVRIAIHRDPIAFLPMRVAQTLGYYEQEGLTVELSELAGGTKAIEALLGGSVDVAAGSMSDAVALAAAGRAHAVLCSLHTSDCCAGGCAEPGRNDSKCQESQGPDGGRVGSRIGKSPTAELPAGDQRSAPG